MTQQTQDKAGFRWQPNLGVLIFVAVFLPLTIALGFWQLSREAEKQALLDEYREREVAVPVALSTVDAEADHQYRRVRARGIFLNEFTVLLENRVRQGKPGFEVVTLFKVEDNGAPIWVNRGWIAGYLERARLPEVPVVTGSVEIFGHLYRPLKEPFVVGDEVWRSRWPQVLQNLDMTALAERLKMAPSPYQLRLDQGSSGALQSGWDVVNVMPEKHRGYAVQWFAMAFALAVLAIFANSNLAIWLFGKKAEESQER